MGWRTYEMIMLSGARPGFTGLVAAVAPTRHKSSQVPRGEPRGSSLGGAGARAAGSEESRGGRAQVPRSARPRGAVVDLVPDHDARLATISRPTQ